MAVEVEEQLIAPAAAPVSAVPAKKPSKAKVAKSKPAHPAWAKMICDAVKELNEKGGSSIPAIKKFIVSHNSDVDKDKLTPFMRRGIKAALSAGTLIQAKGHGLTGSFKLGGKKVATPLKKDKAPKKKSGEKKASPKKVIAKKVKKAPAEKKTKEVKKPVAGATEKTKVAKKATEKPKKSAKATVPKAKKPAVRKTAAKRAPKVEKKKAMKPKATKTAKAPKAPKPKTTKKVASKPKAKAAAPK